MLYLYTITHILAATNMAATTKQPSYSPPLATEAVYVMVNNRYRGHIPLSRVSTDNYCITPSLLTEWGLKAEIVAEFKESRENCILSETLAAYNIQTTFDAKDRRLIMVVPKLWFSESAAGFNANRWDDGITAAFVNYVVNYAHYGGELYQDEVSKNSVFGDFSYGVNYGPWRLRYKNNYQRDTDGIGEWYAQQAYIERGINSQRVRLKMGDSNTPADIFDSYYFRGLTVFTDERMLPDELRQFSPDIRGFAQTAAEVKVWQNGLVIFRKFVPAGPFILKNIYPPSDNGSLYISIRENNGRETTRLLPFASMPNLVHHKQFKYSLTGGVYHSLYENTLEQPRFMQGTLTYGLSPTVTLYTGGTISPIYRSFALGIGKSLGHFGAASFDYRYSLADQPRKKMKQESGSVYRLRYNKAFFEFGASLSLMGQWYPKNDFRSFNEAVQQQHIDWWDIDDDDGSFIGELEAQKRYRLESTLNMYVNVSDSLYFTLVKQGYYDKEKQTNSIIMGYSGNYKRIDYGMDFSYNKYDMSSGDKRLSFNISLPIDAFKALGLRVKYSNNFKREGNYHRFGLTGSALENYNLTYGATIEKNSQNGKSGFSTDLGYEHNAGNVSLGYTKNSLSNQSYIDLSGSALLHAGGLTFGQELGETIALVHVPQSSGINIDNQFGVTTNFNGRAIVTDLTPYRMNLISLDEYSLPDDRYLRHTNAEVVPTAGAVVLAPFAGVQFQLDKDSDEQQEEDD